ncbi:MAG: glycosyltransferase [Ignavibacteriae bacterium]|nr:glycosyltransferase [Ignavibacteriota bacterium]
MMESSGGVRVSVIIVNYNVRDLLENCLHSLEPALRGIPHEVCIVDNNSDDGSVEMLRQKFPGVRLMAQDANLGFARANNVALREARGDFLLLLNPDTLVQEDTVSTMLAFFEKHERAGMAGCKIITPKGTLEPACRRSFPSPWTAFTKLAGLSAMFPASRLFARYNLTYLNEDETYEVDAISGSFMMLRRDVYEKVGGLDEGYFMYGEDLDWCYRVQQAGFGVYYVHETKIIHYGGESTKRSSIDAQAIFYEAMDVFVRKNLKPPAPYLLLITLGIRLRLLVSRLGATADRIGAPLLDAATAMLALLAAEYIRNGALFSFPAYAYPLVYIVMALVVVLTQLAAGTYTRREYLAVRAAVGSLFGFLVLSSLTYFFREYAFSRFVVLLASALALALLTGRRIVALLAAPQRRASFLTGRRTLLVGLSEQAVDILGRLRDSATGTYDVLGLIDVTHKRLGENIAGVEVVGSIENIGKIISTLRISDVIFAPDVVSYSDILSIISRGKGLSVQYRIVPRSMEVIVGKTGIDQLTGVPLVDVEYNLLRPSNRFFKRFFDIAGSFFGIVLFGPVVALLPRPEGPPSSTFRGFVRALPSVFTGRRSLVGVTAEFSNGSRSLYLGKEGLAGIIQLRGGSAGPDERLNLAIQYARNHSLFSDAEILLRTFVTYATRRSRAQAHGE